jgi:hypothetical protein
LFFPAYSFRLFFPAISILHVLYKTI